ncbi:MAG: 50S ribosomal protein L18 [Chloroflexi bacterium]|nr:50S ribosomal protein L18 [Chloroflexota bacterium]
MMSKQNRDLQRKRRHLRVRRALSGTSERPRLNVFRSLRHIYVQIIDDSIGHTLIAASSEDPALQASLKGLNKSEQARVVGQTVARRALEHGVNSVVFDRGGFQYHGRVKTLADAAREGGLQF